MKYLLLLLPLVAFAETDYQKISPLDAPYIRNIPTLAPNGSYVYGVPTLAPDGSYVSGTPVLTPNGKYVGVPDKPYNPKYNNTKE